ncbi:hypothetical protein EDC04DRAFT_2912387 [Pisolithus marmoratus]|nr:hypothetical protein EDC04DRAFT_2912387 [Pisolithus marmoratus]
MFRKLCKKVADFEIAQEYGEDDGLFDKIFETLLGNEGTRLRVLNKGEFTTFYNILRCWQEDAGKPPFFCDGGSDVKRCPGVFRSSLEPVRPSTSGASTGRKSDLMVSSQGHLIPFFVSEVISMKSEDDRFRMLLQAIAAARAGKILLKKTAERKFFVVAVYLNKNMIASRYIVMQTGQDNDEPTEEFRQGNAEYRFLSTATISTLPTGTEATEFAREMYNLVGELNDLADDLDRNTARTLKQIVDAAKDVLSLHSKTYPVQRTQASRLDSIPEQGASEEPHEDMEGSEEDELGVFGADDVQEHLSNMDSMVDFRVFGHENLAVVRRKTDDSVGYLKFVETARQREVKILQFLSGIQSPMNHTISGVGFWPVQGGTMISMPVAGARLTSLEKPNEHLWSAASQLVEGVAFMHAHLVAHMDLKPENIIIPPQGGRLSIIDFSSSILLKSEKQKFRGIAGTTGYIAPEVERGDAYKPSPG